MTTRPAILVALGLMACVVACRADDAKAIKKRMAERLPAITEMKTNKSVGEDNRGYLKILHDAAANTAIVQAENADRKRVYEVIAKRTGASADVVGARRAAQIARQSTAGIMLQGKDGKWYEKTSSE